MFVVNISESTLDQLVRSGARLMADQYWETVDLAEVARDAGARDVAAVIHYFGSREGLLMEIVGRGVAAMELRRREELAELTPETELLDLVRALFAPLADLLLEPEHRDFLRLNAQLGRFLKDSDNTLAGPMVGTAFGAQWQMLSEALALRLGPEAARRRVGWLMVVLCAVMGSRADQVTQWLGEGGGPEEIDAAAEAAGELPHREYVDEMCRQFTAALLA